jgi:hypothetical protein
MPDTRQRPTSVSRADGGCSLISRDKVAPVHGSRSRIIPTFQTHSYHASSTRLPCSDDGQATMSGYNQEHLAESEIDRHRYLLMANTLLGIRPPTQHYKDFSQYSKVGPLHSDEKFVNNIFDSAPATKAVSSTMARFATLEPTTTQSRKPKRLK